MIHKTFADWVEAEILPLDKEQVRLDGRTSGGNRKIFGKFKHAGRNWSVNSDTRVDRVLRAYSEILSSEGSDPFIEEATPKGKCLNLVERLRFAEKAKRFYVYATS